MASGAEITQTLESSATTKTGGIEARAIGADAPEVFYSAIANKKPAAVAAARRSALTAVDATASLVDAGYTAAAVDMGNSIHAAVHCRFSAAGQSCAIALAMYDEADALIGITRDYVFQAGVNTDGTLYVAPLEMIDIGPAASVFPILRVAPASGNVSVYIQGL